MNKILTALLLVTLVVASAQAVSLIDALKLVQHQASAVTIPEGSQWYYAPWGGVCTARWVDGELWMARDPLNTSGVRVFKTKNKEGLVLTQLNKFVTLSWDNVDAKKAFMPNDSTISVIHGDTVYNFIAIYPIPEGSQWYYAPWGGVCTARWVNGELWMARDPLSTSGVRVFKTQNGNGNRLMSLNVVTDILWDNTANLSAYRPNANEILVKHGNTLYAFNRV